MWYLEHVTTGARLILHNGTNLMGRHSRCRIILGGQYQFVSREHANIIVSEKGVEVESLVGYCSSPKMYMLLIVYAFITEPPEWALHQRGQIGRQDQPSGSS